MKRKFQKEDIQKIILGALLFLGVVYGYFDLLLGPLKKRQQSTTASIAALEPEISKAKAAIAASEKLEADAPVAEQTVSQIESLIPEGAPVSWFPVLINDFFKQAGVEKSLTRMLNESSEKDVAGFRRIGWGIDIPETRFIAFGAAVADLENREPLVAIKSVSIEALRDDPETQRVMLTVNNIAKE
ncbi:MAG: hypothetical protein ABI680_04175 [Chthoniobacteraceae bacterium]